MSTQDHEVTAKKAKMVQMVDRVLADEPGVEVSAVYQAGTVVLTIIKDNVPLATATLGEWRWERLHKIEVEE